MRKEQRVMTCEPFTAVAMCPQCSAVDVWPWREPNKYPRGDSPLELAQVQIAYALAAITCTEPFDPDDATVVRQCRCGHEWAQR